MHRLALGSLILTAPLLFGCGLSSHGGGQPNCSKPQTVGSHDLPPIDIAVVGKPFTVKVASPLDDSCHSLSGTQTPATATDPSGATVSATAVLNPYYLTSSSRALLVADATFTPANWGWHTVTVDFKELGGPVSVNVFVAADVAVTTTLPYACDSLQRGSAGILCDGKYVRGVTTVHDFAGASVSVSDDVLWEYNWQNGTLGRYRDTGSGDVVEDPVTSTSVPRYQSFGPWMISTRDELLVRSGTGSMTLYDAPVSGVRQLATFSSPLLESSNDLLWDGDWIYIITPESTVCPVHYDSQASQFTAGSCFTVTGKIIGGLRPATLVVERDDTLLLTSDIDTRPLVAGSIQPAQQSIRLPYGIETDPFYGMPPTWQWQTNVYAPIRVFTLISGAEGVRLGQLPLERHVCYSACEVWPGKLPGLLYWPEPGKTQLVELP